MFSEQVTDLALYNRSINCVFQDSLLQSDQNILLEDMNLDRKVSLPSEPSDTIMSMLKCSFV